MNTLAAPLEMSEVESITKRGTVLVYNIADKKAMQLHNVLHVKYSDGTILYIECTTLQEDTGTVTFHLDRQTVWESTDDGVGLLEGKIALFVDNTSGEQFIALYPANESGTDVESGITLLENEHVMTYEGEPYTPHPSENLEMEDMNVPQWLPPTLVGPMDKDALVDAMLGEFDASGLPAIIQENMDEDGRPRAWEHVVEKVRAAMLLSDQAHDHYVGHMHPEGTRLVHFFKKTDLTVVDLRLIESAVYDTVIVLEFNLGVDAEVIEAVRAVLEDIDDPDAKTLADKFTTLLCIDDQSCKYYYFDVKDRIISKYKQCLPSFSDVYGLDAVEECEDDGDCSWIGDYYMQFRFDFETDRLMNIMLEYFALEHVNIPASSDFKDKTIAKVQQGLNDSVAAKEKAGYVVDAEDVALSAKEAAGKQSCAICLKKDVVRMWLLACGHIIGCLRCTKIAIENDKLCAICRQPVHLNDPQPLLQQVVDAVRFLEENANLDANSTSYEGVEFVE